MTYRIVAWNCADNFDWKARRLANLGADICVVPEVREAHARALGEDWASFWDGDLDQRGLLIAARPPWRLEAIGTAAERHMLLVTASRGDERLSVVGVWAMRGPNGYAGSVIAGLDTLLPVVGARTIVTGDFNASPVFDTKGPASQRFAHISDRCHAAGLESLWHSSRGEPFGNESSPTYHHQWKREQPFHIDFMFASAPVRERLSAFSIGAYDEWLPDGSDHMPLIADLKQL